MRQRKAAQSTTSSVPDETTTQKLTGLSCWGRRSCVQRFGILSAWVGGLLALTWGGACAAQAFLPAADCSRYPAVPGTEGVPLIFVPGFSGSRLLSPADGSELYLTVGQALGIHAPDLSLPLSWKQVPTADGDGDGDGTASEWRQDVDSHGGLRPGGPIDAITVLPCLRVPVYAPFMAWAATCSGRPFYAFSYDWRRDGLENSAKLVAYIRTVSAAHGGSRVQLVGHSNGGVLSLTAVNEVPHLVHSVVYAGAPFKAGWASLKPFTLGWQVGLTNGNSLSADRFRGTTGYLTFAPLLPEDQDATHLIDGDTGQVVQWNLSDPTVWVSHRLATRLSVEDGAGSPEEAAASVTAMMHAVARATAVRRKMRPLHPPAVYPPSVVLMNDGLPVSKNWTVVSATGRIDFAAPQAVVKGDGVVRYEAALLPDGIPYRGVVKTAQHHNYLLSDIAAVREALSQLATAAA